ncbi:hypothetical protein ACFE04_018374 [Oxalis oulophora]
MPRLIVCFTLLVLWLLMITLSECSENKSNKELMKKRYEKWLQKHGRGHLRGAEWEKRFAIYQFNVEFIDYINAQNKSYKLTDNRFADMTNEEFRANCLGFLPKLSQRKKKHSRVMHGDLPANVDWREKGAVTPIRQQGQCESCWAFSAVSAVESINQIKTGSLVSLSEQELVDCDIEGKNIGCKGGLMDDAFQFIMENGGLSTAEEYPYTATNGSCKASLAKNITMTISGYENVPENDEKSLEAAVVQQPVSVAVDASSLGFRFYSEGIFTGYCGTQLDHGVNAIGYGEDNNGEKYWLVRNSWGSGWGESGYIRLKRGVTALEGTCGIAMMASYPVK